MKIKRKKPLIIAVGVVALIVALEMGSVWYGIHHPQTLFQTLATKIKHNVFPPKLSSEIVFLGDSIFARQDWAGLMGVNNIFNAGISGNTTEDVLARVDFLVNLRPQKIFLLLGINDLAKGKEVPLVMENYKTIINKIKTGSPGTKIFIISVLPVDSELSPIGKIDSQKIIALNRELRAFSSQEGAVFINLYPSFIESGNTMDDSYASDGVHPNAKGYALMQTLLVPYIK